MCQAQARASAASTNKSTPTCPWSTSISSKGGWGRSNGTVRAARALGHWYGTPSPWSSATLTRTSTGTRAACLGHDSAVIQWWRCAGRRALHAGHRIACAAAAVRGRFDRCCNAFCLDMASRVSALAMLGRGVCGRTLHGGGKSSDHRRGLPGHRAAPGAKDIRAEWSRALHEFDVLRPRQRCGTSRCSQPLTA